MLLTAVTLDAFMTASDALARLARHGLWLDPAEPEAAKWIAERATLLGLEIPETERRLKRDIQAYGVAVRRQADANILWYALDAVTVVSRCAHKSTQPLIDVLRLHETDSVESVEPANADGRRASVVVQDGAPAAVCISPPTAAASPPGSAPPRSRGPQPTVPAGAPRPSEIHSSGLWPRVDAPEYARAGQRFDVVIGLGASKQEGLAGGPLGITLPAGADTFPLAIELASDGFDAPDGWSRTMTVPVDNPTAATVSISLVGREPIGVQPVHLTTIEVRYLIGTTVCGFAARPIVIGRTTDRPPDFFKGVAWLAQPSFGLFEASPTDIVEPDLTLELAKPDRNPARG